MMLTHSLYSGGANDDSRPISDFRSGRPAGCTAAPGRLPSDDPQNRGAEAPHGQSADFHRRRRQPGRQRPGPHLGGEGRRPMTSKPVSPDPFPNMPNTADLGDARKMVKTTDRGLCYRIYEADGKVSTI